MPTSTIDQQGLASKIDIHPNPTAGDFTIAFPRQLLERNLNIKIVDVLGRTLLDIDNGDRAERLTVNIPEMNSGVFFVVVSGEKFEHVERLVKQ